ncbi:MAG: class I SAM-dependent methyltransferase [Planctomycetota bacterium]|jgi:ubiquinone/menaquinone biosynthesis C-methylase UbiE|nr:class I SAM-dependent methyltransferase [Planctomycetota bacterium]MDP7133258.1 class I SAM-dependent methyltransferase [Planctomycetota bacterium]MDP7251995.1 class I SAM-dependent methyltransferase [Planctomycetota bacterium]
MGLYADYIFPLCCDTLMSAPDLQRIRKQALENVSGEILEIGFGTGLNLPHYPAEVGKITTVEVSKGMNRKALKRIEDSGIEVDSKILDGKSLPMVDESFDCIVVTWTLCSIREIDSAMIEMHRVLRPGGRLVFVEHGLSNEARIQRWQNFFTPFQKIFAVGCHLNRDMKAIIEKPGFSFENLQEFYLDNAPKPLGYTYQGVAVK